MRPILGIQGSAEIEKEMKTFGVDLTSPSLQIKKQTKFVLTQL